MNNKNLAAYCLSGRHFYYASLFVFAFVVGHVNDEKFLKDTVHTSPLLLLGFLMMIVMITDLTWTFSHRILL